jgi:hypothetical protein
VRISMNSNQDCLCGRGKSTLWALGLLLVFGAACGGSDSISPSEAPSAGAPLPGDSAGIPTDSAGVPLDSTLLPVDSLGFPIDSTGAVTPSALAAGTQPGIVFGSTNMDAPYLSTVHTGTLKGGGLTPTNVLSLLSAARSKRARVVMKLCMGSDSYIKNADGTFSLTKWKALVARFKVVNLAPYIIDGTILGHYLIDEPSRAERWGGRIISQATLEAMAQYSKQLWPDMTTFVRVVPSWLAQAPVTYRYLDAGWLQYASNKGDVTKLVAAEVAAGKARGLGLVVGLNLLDGGNGSSGIRGATPGKYSMSATELRTYATALLNQSYACGFYNYSYNFTGPTYYARTDIKAAMTDMSNKAKAHIRTSCKQ